MIDAPNLNDVEATGPSGAAVTLAATATDLVDGSTPVTYWLGTTEIFSGDTFPLGVTTVTAKSSDSVGNTASADFTVAVVDTTAPVISDVPKDMTLEATSADGAMAIWDAPTASDLVDGPVDVSCDAVSGDTFPLGETTVTVNATDSAGNTATDTFTVTVVDTTAPQISGVPADMTLEATSADGAIATWDAPTASDLVDGPVDVSCDANSGDTFPLGETTVTVSATDSAGNTASTDFTVTVVDTTAPVITVPADMTVEATSPDGAIATWDAPTASDLVDGSVDVSCDAVSGDTFALGETTVTVSATDSAGNVATKTFKITVVDTTAPVISGVPKDMTVEATSADGAIATWAAPTAADLVDGTVAVSCSSASGSTFPIGETTVTATATDAAGNKAEASFKVKVVDTTKPAISAPDVSKEATGPETKVDLAATASDVVDGSLAVSYTLKNGDPLPADGYTVGDHVLTAWATDKAGNTATKDFTVTITDTTPPAIDAPDVTKEATGPETKVDLAATASDVVDGSLAVSYTLKNGDPLPADGYTVGDHVLTAWATDKAGNTATKDFTVTITDTTPPALSVPGDMTVEAAGPDGAKVDFIDQISATDLVDDNPTVKADPASGSTFPLGETTVTATATDAAGNKAEASFKVKVVDTTKPAISAPDVSKEATGPETKVDLAATASDVVDGSLAVSYTLKNGDPLPADGYTVGDHVLTAWATDKAGNTATKDFTVTITDTTPPAIDAPDVTKEATGPETKVDLAATASDVVDGSLAVSYTLKNGDPLPADGYTVGDHVLTAWATDKAGNTATKDFTVTITDTTPPALSVPGDMTVEAAGPDGAKVDFIDQISATDLVDNNPTVKADPASGSTFPLGETTVTATATDAAGNKAEASFKVKVVDTTPPTGSLTINGGAGHTTSFSVKLNPSASDAVGVSWMRFSNTGDFTGVDWKPYASADYSWSLDAGADGSRTVHAQYKDAAGNVSTGTISASIILDTTGPAMSITSPADGATVTSHTPELDYTTGDAVAASVVVKVDGTTVDTASGHNLDALSDGAHTVTVTGADQWGNPSTASSTFTVDTTGPAIAISKPADGATVTSHTPELDYTTGDAVAASVVVKVDGTVVGKTSGDTLDSLADGAHTVTVSGADQWGNETTVSSAFMVDTTGPAIAITKPASGSSVATATPELDYTTGDAVAASVVVKVDGTVVTTASGDELDSLADGAHTVTVSGADQWGNPSTASATFTVDTTGPAVSITSPVDGATVTTHTPKLIYDAGDASSVVVKVDGDTVSKTSGDDLDVLADGSHTVKVIGTDAVGNSATATSTFTVDTTGPAIAISKPADGATVTSHTPELDYTTGDAVAASVVVKVDGTTVDKASGDNLDALSRRRAHRHRDRRRSVGQPEHG